jgi:N utilization substance protein B
VSGRAASRRSSRAAALQVLYAMDLPPRTGGAPSGEQVFEEVARHFELPEGARAFAKELVCGVGAHRRELDARLAAHAEHWRLERMSAVDRNVLRLAAFELLHTLAPVPVVIDEAVELARRFGGERSPAFVNGVLDALAREARPR